MSLTFALATPSYSGDFERCRLLVESVARCVTPQVPFYLMVPKKDLALFETLKEFYPVTLLTQESLLPWYVIQTPFSRKYRLNLFGMPVRGWIAQQICKIALAQHIKQDVMLILDSDVCFVRPLDLNEFVKGDQVRLLSVPDRGNSPDHYPWHRLAAKMIGLPATDYFGDGYIGQAITWRRDVVLKMIEHLKKRNRFWRLAILNSLTFSEYILYGVYAEHFLKEQSGHYKETYKGVKEYWTPKPLTEEELGEFFATVEDNFAVMLTAKGGIGPKDYINFVRELWDKQVK
jgi:Family of unknown function (DUF6492)